MKWSWLRAALLGLMIGPIPATAEPMAESELEPSATEWDLDKRRGYAVDGATFYVWDEDSGQAIDWASELLQANTGRGELPHWRGVATTAAAAPAMLTNEQERELAISIESGAGISNGAALGLLVCLLPSLDRTVLVTSWATSPSEPIRAALARALAAPFEAVGVHTVIEHLQADPSPEVRRLARAAAASRRSLLV